MPADCLSLICMNFSFNYYAANIKKSKVLGTITLDYMLAAIKSPKKNIADTFAKIRQAEIDGNMKLKNELKTSLYSFTPCVFVDKTRKYSNIITFTGIAVLDFDHLEESYAIEFKNYLFNEYKFIIAIWLSPSRHGIKVLIKIPICQSIEEFKSRFNAIEQDFGIYNGFDSTTKNCILPLFMSYDPDILIRNDFTEYTKKYNPIVSLPIKQYIVKDKSNFIEKIISKRINAISKITGGHHILRSTAYLLGGYVGASQIQQAHAEQMITDMINSNSYLCQKASVYIKTAKTMIQKGSQLPVYL